MDVRSQPEFRPQTGRGPIGERNKDGLPIGEFLYETAREKALHSQEKAEEQEEQERAQASTPKIGQASRQLFEATKQRKYRDLFEMLVCRDPGQRLSYETMSIDSLDEDLMEFLRPMVAYLKETKASLEFESFVAALDYQRQHSVTPTAHLFVPKCKPRTSERYRQECEAEVFTPRTDPNSNRIASKHRPRGAVPLHEQLLREKEAWDAKIQEQRLLQDERALEECTFQPLVGAAAARARSSERSCERISRGRAGGTPTSTRSRQRAASEGADDQWEDMATAIVEHRLPSPLDLQACRSPVSDSAGLGGARAIRLGGVNLADPVSAPETPQRLGMAVNHHVITSLAGSRDRTSMDGVFNCQSQVEQAEQAVDRCQALLSHGAAGTHRDHS